MSKYFGQFRQNCLRDKHLVLNCLVVIKIHQTNKNFHKLILYFYFLTKMKWLHNQLCVQPRGDLDNLLPKMSGSQTIYIFCIPVQICGSADPDLRRYRESAVTIYIVYQPSDAGGTHSHIIFSIVTHSPLCFNFASLVGSTGNWDSQQKR